MRKIDKIFVHCSASPDFEPCPALLIRKDHIERGFSDIGYHYVIQPSGKIEVGRPLDKMGAHCKAGRGNYGSVAICLAGGLGSKRTDRASKHFSPEALKSLRRLIESLRLVLEPADPTSIELFGHHDFEDGKECPGFRVRDWWENPNG